MVEVCLLDLDLAHGNFTLSRVDGANRPVGMALFCSACYCSGIPSPAPIVIVGARLQQLTPLETRELIVTISDALQNMAHVMQYFCSFASIHHDVRRGWHESGGASHREQGSLTTTSIRCDF